MGPGISVGTRGARVRPLMNEQVEVGMEVEKQCGEIEKLTVFEHNPDGVIAVKFKVMLFCCSKKRVLDDEETDL